MAATAPPPVLHGREAEVGVLNQALDQAASGRLAVVLGRAGVTALPWVTLAEVAGAAGNPLFVTELLETIRQDGILRLSFLPEETLQALRSASILGSAFSLTELSAAMDRPVLALSQAAATSPDAAANLLERAIGLMDPRDPARDRMLAERAGSLMLAGRIFEAEAECRGLLDRGHDPVSEGPARVCLGRALLAQGRAQDGLRELEQAAGSPALADAERAAAQGWASGARWALGDLDGAASAAEQARAAATAAGDHLTISAATTILALVPEHRGGRRPDPRPGQGELSVRAEASDAKAAGLGRRAGGGGPGTPLPGVPCPPPDAELPTGREVMT
jgi:hypothetical protein